MWEMEAIHGELIIARKQERLVFAAGKLDRFACRGIPHASLRLKKENTSEKNIQLFRPCTGKREGPSKDLYMEDSVLKDNIQKKSI